PPGAGRRQLGPRAHRGRPRRPGRPAGGRSPVTGVGTPADAGTTPTADPGAGVPALEVRGVGLRIGGAQILQDVSFEVPRGQIVGVIGPNGAGKTTLFNLISGVRAPSTGSILLDGT